MRNGSAAGLGRGRESAVGCANGRTIPDFLGVTGSVPALARQSGHQLLLAGGLVTCPGRGWQGGSGELDAMGLRWMSWDMFQNVCRADQAYSGITDVTRTAGEFHAY